MNNTGRNRKTMAVLLKFCAVMLLIASAARLTAGYVVRCWMRFTQWRNPSVDLVAPKYGPALVVSTEDFEDGLDQILSDGYYTQTFRRLARLEIVRKMAMAVFGIGLLTTFFLWLFTPEER